MKRSLTTSLLVALLFVPTLYLARAMGDEAGSEKILFVSIISLIADSNKFDEKAVIVQGVVGGSRDEGWAIYLTSEFRDHHIVTNAIWLESTPEIEDQLAAIDGKWTSVRGRFDGDRGGHLGVFPGVIKEIKRIAPPID